MCDLKRLKSLRHTRGLTQQEVADLLGITQQTYANYERGMRNPDNEMLVKLADVFHVNLDYLLGRTSIAQPVQQLQEQQERSAAQLTSGKSYSDLPDEAVRQLMDYEAFLREKYKK